MSYAATITLTGVRADESFLTRQFELNQACPSLLIGRSSSRKQHDRGSPESANAYFTCPVVSRKHAELCLSGGLVRIKDLGSLHGTAVNGTKCSPDRAHSLFNNDIVSVGSTILEGPQKHFAVVFQVHIAYRHEKPSQPPKLTTFVDLSSPVPSPTPAAVKPVTIPAPPSALSPPASKEPAFAHQRETFVVPEPDSPENSSDLDDDDLMIDAILNIEAPIKGSSNKTDESGLGNIQDEEEELEEEEEAVFTPESSAMSSPVSSPLPCEANKTLEINESLRSVANDNTAALNATTVQQSVQPASSDSMRYPPFISNAELAHTSASNGGPSWQDPERHLFDYARASAPSSYISQSRGLDSTGNEYHSFFPVHGLTTQALAPVSSAWAPSTSLSNRMYSDPLFTHDSNPLAESCSTFVDVESSTKGAAKAGAVKDAVMSIDNIVSKDATATPTLLEPQNAIKRKAATLDDDTSIKVGSEPLNTDAQKSQNLIQLASTTSDLGKEVQDGPNKKPRLAETVSSSMSTNGHVNTSKKGGLGQFALGALAGGAGVLGALIFLPDSVFF